MKKRGLALLMALALTLSLAACGGTEETPDDTADTAEEETIPSGGEADLAEEETPEEETPEEDGTTEAIDEIEKEETDEPEMGSGTADPAQKPQTGTAPADPNKTSDAKPVQEPPSAPQEPASGSGTDAQPPAEETAGGTEPETPAEGTDTSAVDLAAFAASVTSDQETWPGMMAMEGESLDMFYAGLSGIATRQCLVQMAMISASGDEIALVEVENSADVQAVKDIFQARIDYQVGDGTAPGGAWYPAPTEMWRSESRIVSNGNFVMLVAHTGADAVVEQFNALFA